jgi:hypothetical protein
MSPLARRGVIVGSALVVGALASVTMLAGPLLRDTPASRAQEARRRIKAVEQALVAYQTDNHDKCSKQLNYLYTDRYLTQAPKDPWGEQLVFTCPGEHDQDRADIVSKGKDRLLGTPDDFRSWEL